MVNPEQEGNVDESVWSALEKARSEPKFMSGQKAAKVHKLLAAHFCGCSCHQIIQIDLVPCPRCDGKDCS